MRPPGEVTVIEALIISLLTIILGHQLWQTYRLGKIEGCLKGIARRIARLEKQVNSTGED